MVSGVKLIGIVYVWKVQWLNFFSNQSKLWNKQPWFKRLTAISKVHLMCIKRHELEKYLQQVPVQRVALINKCTLIPVTLNIKLKHF